MRDAVALEDMGVPAATIVLVGFKELARSTPRLLGRPDLEYVILPGTLDSPATARAKGEQAVPLAVAHLTGTQPA